MTDTQAPSTSKNPLSLLWGARLFLLSAMAGAGYLAAVALLHGGVAGCGDGMGCNSVLGSRWAYWFGIPVSLPALAIYLALFFLTWMAKPAATVALSVLVMCAAGWFVFLQYFAIESWCRFCLATHASACLAALLLLRSIPVQRREFLNTAIFTLGIGMVALVGGQLAGKRQFYRLFAGGATTSGSLVILHGGKFQLDPGELPLMGSTSATNFLVSLFDYTCAHCRTMHPFLKTLEEKYSGRLAIISLPVPLDSKCNPLVVHTAPDNAQACAYAKLGLAVWWVSRKAFRAYDDWFFAVDRTPPLEQAEAKAQSLIGAENLARALADPWVERQIAFDISLYRANGLPENNPHLPQMVIGDITTHGEIGSYEELERLVAQHTPLGGVKTPAH